MSTLRVAVVDDHVLFRAGLIGLLGTSPDLQVVAEGGSGDEAIGIARTHAPDVMLMDVEMPGPGAGRVLREVLTVSPETSVLVLTAHDDVTVVRTLLRHGAAGYVLKTADIHQLFAAIQSIGGSSKAVSVSLSRSTLDALAGGGGDSSRTLSKRECEVLDLVAQARSNVEIAAELYMSVGTVKRHLTNIYAKIGATSRIEALVKARALGMIGSSDASGT
jgi:DNA-binding NarL/FixJ family response regulator